MNRVVVYTAITDDKDELDVPEVVPDDVSFVCFTDGSCKVRDPWESRPATSLHGVETPRRVARYHKTMSHRLFPHADYSIWVDGIWHLKTDPKPWTDILRGRAHLAAHKHPVRDCIYDEARVCAEGKDDPRTISRQIDGYRQAGYPEKNGLAATWIVIRRHSHATEMFNELWWSEIATGSCRDQLSFDYVSWRLGVPYMVIPDDRIKRDYASRGHKR